MPETVDVAAASAGSTPSPSNSQSLTLRSMTGFFTRKTTSIAAAASDAKSTIGVSQVGCTNGILPAAVDLQLTSWRGILQVNLAHDHARTKVRIDALAPGLARHRRDRCLRG